MKSSLYIISYLLDKPAVVVVKLPGKLLQLRPEGIRIRHRRHLAVSGFDLLRLQKKEKGLFAFFYFKNNKLRNVY